MVKETQEEELKRALASTNRDIEKLEDEMADKLWQRQFFEERLFIHNEKQTE